MTETIGHRGPDGEGCAIDGPAALGHRRLRIVDLVTGDQPMRNEDGSLIIVFNGEIYNFQELRPDLEKAGHVFRTRSDTEVILHAYEQYGDACLERFNGMFAFALWDSRRKRLFAARDRMGEKPLYYAQCGGGLVFASELKALLNHPAVRVRLTPHSIGRYLAFGYVPAPDTIYDGIRKLPAAHSLTYCGGAVETRPYWTVDFERADLRGLSPDRLQERFLNLFRDSVRLRLISDVPLGVFLSGGVDSSAVVAMMCELMPPGRVKTFSIGFREPAHDESAYARRVAAHFGTDHHERILDEQTMLDRLPGIIANMDEPFADSSISPTSLVSEFARTRVTVALGGDGGDELFAGYNTFRLDQLAAHYARLPRLIRRSMIEPAMAAAGALSGHRRIGRGGEYVGDAADTPESWRVMLWSEAVVKPPFMRAVLTADALGPQSLYDDTIRLYEQAPRRSRLARVQYQYQHQYLPEDILTKVDRASMMHSLEVRAPFLDPRVVDFANALPDCLKLRGSAGKWFLKQVFRRRLPAEILFRRKMGFGIPMDQWLRSGLRVHFERLCSTEALRNQGIFRPEPLEQLWQQHLSGRRDCGGLLWTFLAFQLWWERHRPVTAHAQ